MFATLHVRTVLACPAILLAIGFLWPRSSILLGSESTPDLLLPEIFKTAVPIDRSIVAASVSDLCQAIESHKADRLDEAMAIWQNVALPRENEVWRHLALGVTYLYTGRLDDAAGELASAKKHDSDNAVVHYFSGLLRLEQAKAAREYPDALHLAGTRLVSHFPNSEPTQPYGIKPKSRYELEAIDEFEHSIQHAANVDLHAPLVPVCWVVAVPCPAAALTPPTVEDLLLGLGADNFAGKAHGLLACIYADRDRPDEAEYHLDGASSHGIRILYGYRLVGRLYEEQGRSSDAFRAYLKAMKGGEGLAGPGAKALQNLGNVFEQLF